MGPDLSYSLAAWPRGTFNVDAGYEQAGAVAADTAAAVGVDTHDGHGGVSYSYDLGPGDSLTPELRYDYTHYEHALLGGVTPDAAAGTGQDAFARGPADVHAVSLTTGWSHEIGRRWRTVASGGLTVGSPMPGIGSSHVVVAPRATASLRWTGRRTFVTARYAYAYTSLGPRIGYGQEHTATIRVTTQPAEGARLRDLVVTGIGRFSHGGAPLAEDPENLLPVPGGPALPPDGKLTTTTAAGALLIEYPLRRGLAFTSRFDLVFVHGVVNPRPRPGRGRRSSRRRSPSASPSPSRPTSGAPSTATPETRPPRPSAGRSARTSAPWLALRRRTAPWSTPARLLTVTFNNDTVPRPMKLLPDRPLLQAALLLALLGAAVPAHATEYWTLTRLLGDFFAGAERVSFKPVTLSDADAAAIEKRLGAPVKRAWSVYCRDGRRQAHAATPSGTQEIGLHEPIDFGVRFGLGGAVERVEIMAYREAYGDEVRQERFRKQFVGKTAGDPITAGQGHRHRERGDLSRRSPSRSASSATRSSSRPR